MDQILEIFIGLEVRLVGHIRILPRKCPLPLGSKVDTRQRQWSDEGPGISPTGWVGGESAMFDAPGGPALDRFDFLVAQ